MEVMAIKKNEYEVISSLTGEVLCRGTGSECAELLGDDVTADKLRAAARRGFNLCKKYKVRFIDEDFQQEDGSDAETIKAWNEFCEPIRKKYNIPVYKAKPEVRG